MFCSKCGTEIPDEANFCWKCGKPQRPDVSPVASTYETCEIVYGVLKQNFLFDDLGFWAKAIGKNGTYNAGFSPKIFVGDKSLGPKSDIETNVNAHNALVKKLINDGWEPTGGRGEAWFNLRFKRLVKE
jgi:hypothetical protein